MTVDMLLSAGRLRRKNIDSGKRHITKQKSEFLAATIELVELNLESLIEPCSNIQVNHFVIYADISKSPVMSIEHAMCAVICMETHVDGALQILTRWRNVASLETPLSGWLRQMSFMDGDSRRSGDDGDMYFVKRIGEFGGNVTCVEEFFTNIEDAMLFAYESYQAMRILSNDVVANTYDGRTHTQ